MENRPIVELKNISMRYGDSLVLENVNFQLQAGNIHCLMGYNGSGKSTLAGIISGECRASSGEVLIDGHPCMDWSVEEAVRHGVVMITGFASLFPQETVLENMQNSLVNAPEQWPLLTRRKWLEEQIDEFTQRYDIFCSLHTPALELSNGDRVLLELLRVRLMKARVLLMDEIDLVVGIRHKRIIRELVEQLRDEGMAVLYISHKLDMVHSLADQVSILQYGEITHFAQRQSFEEGELVEMMFSSSRERPPRIHKTLGEQLLQVRGADASDTAITLYEGEVLGIISVHMRGEAGIYDLLFNYDRQLADIRIRNRRVQPMRLENALENGIVIMSSAMMHLTTFPGSVRKNMLPYNVVRRVRSDRRRDEICQRYINILNIKTTPSAAFETLNMGHQRKVFIARSMLSKGDIFLFDNPTDSIDSVSKIDIYNIINEMKSRGKGIVFLSDDPKEVMGISDRIVTMRGNQISRLYERGEFCQEDLRAFMEQQESPPSPKGESRSPKKRKFGWRVRDILFAGGRRPL